MVNIKERNFLVKEGWAILHEKSPSITKEEWLHLYGEIRDELDEGVQAQVLATIHRRLSGEEVDRHVG